LQEISWWSNVGDLIFHSIASSRSQATATPSMTLQSSYTAIHNGQPELDNSSTSCAQLSDELENEESLDWLRTLFFPFSN
jgi:hypothetical protein